MSNESVLYFAYKRQKAIAEEATLTALDYKRTLEANSNYRKGAKVEFGGSEAYVFECNVWYEKDGSDLPLYWLTLTQLRKDGSFPRTPLKSQYTSSDNVKVIGYYEGDTSNGICSLC